MLIGASIGGKLSPFRQLRATPETAMPDIVIRHIDDALADRIKELARARRWSINDVILHVLRHGLGLAHGDLGWIQAADVAHMAGTWAAEEADAFKDAMAALEEIPDGSFAATGPAVDEDAG